MKPVSLMRLKKLNRPEDVLIYYKPDDLLIEQKFDGFKVLVSKNSKIHLYTRRGIEFTENIPSLAKKLDKILPKNTAILGELVVINEKGKQSLADIQSIVNSKPNHALNVLKTIKGKLVYFVYDLLEYRGINITKKALKERRALLKQLFLKITHDITVSLVYPFSDYKKIIKQSLAAGGEGIVIKPKNSIYKYNKITEHEPVGEWFKYKPSHTEDVILKSYFYRGKEKKAIFPAYQYKRTPGSLVLFEVGKLSGMDRFTEQILIDKIDSGYILVVEVNYQEKYPSGKIRAMGWVRDRTKEKHPKDVIWQK